MGCNLLFNLRWGIRRVRIHSIIRCREDTRIRAAANLAATVIVGGNQREAGQLLIYTADGREAVFCAVLVCVVAVS